MNSALIRIVPKTVVTLVASVMVVSLAASCVLQLKNPAAPPSHPLEGFWIDEGTFGDEDSNVRVVLWIEKYVGDEIPYRFRMMHVQHRELLVSGKIAFTEIREGKILTAGSEVLLRQERFRSASRRNASEAKEQLVWPIKKYTPEILDREVLKGTSLALLKLSANGLSLSDDDWNFRRALGSGARNALGVHAAGVILRASRDGRRAQLWSQFASIKKPGAEFAVYRGGKKVGRLRISEVMEHSRELTAEIIDGRPMTGDAVVAAGPLPNLKAKRLTREQILEKVKRGEKVSKEDLIRALKKK